MSNLRSIYHKFTINRATAPKTFLHYLLSYLVVFVIPIMLMIILYTILNNKFYYNEIRAGNIHALTKTRDTIDSAVLQLDDIAKKLSKSNLLSPNLLEIPSSDWVDAVDQLRMFDNPNDIIMDIVYFIPDNPVLFSSNGTYTFPTFTEYFYIYENWSPNNMLQELSTINTPITRASELVRSKVYSEDMAEGLLTFIYPVPYYAYPQSYGSLILMIPETRFSQLLDNASGEYTSYTLVLDMNSGIIAQSSNCKSDIDPHDLQAIFAGFSETDTGTKSIRIYGKEYLVFHSKSLYKDWVYVSMVSEADSFAKLRTANALFMICLAVSVLTGGVFIYYFMYKNFNPLSSLLELLKPQIKHGCNSSELALATKAALNLSQNVKDLNAKIEKSTPHLRQSLLMRVLRGEYADIAEINHDAYPLGLTFDKPFWLVYVIFTKENAGSGGISHIITEALETNGAKGTDTYLLDGVDLNNWIVIVNTSIYQTSEHIQSIGGVGAALRKCIDGECTIGVGSLFNCPGQLYISYLQAMAAQDFKLVYGINRQISFEEIAETPSASFHDYPYSQLDELHRAMNSRDGERVEFLLDALIRDIRAHSFSIFIVRCIGFNIVTITQRILRTLHTVYGQLDETLNYDILSPHDIDDIELLICNVKRIMRHAIKASVESCSSRNVLLVQDIVHFIDTHFSDDDFSAQMICNEFGVTQSNLSHMFKKHTGENISEYISKKKIDKAKELLATTNSSSQHIARQVGYYDVSGFIRKFKKETGYTPTEYKNISAH